MHERGVRILDFGCKGAFFILACSAIITPICLVDMGKTLQLNLAQRGGLETARGLSLVVVVLVSGWLARKIKSTMLVGAGLCLVALGLFLLGMTRSYPTALGAMAIMGIGSGFIEALVSPIIARIHPDNHEHHLNLTHAFYPIGICFCVLLAGELLSHNVPYRLIYGLSAPVSLGFGLLIVITGPPIDPGVEAKSGSYIQPMLVPFFWLAAFAMFLSAGAEAGFTYWTASFISRYHSAIPRFSGIGTALFSGSMGIGRILFAKLSARCSLRKMLLAASLCGILVSGCITLPGNLTAVYVLLTAAGFAVSGAWPSILAIASRRIHCEKTSLLIMVSASGIGGFSAVPFIIGSIGDRWGLRGGFFLIPLLFIGTSALLISMREKKDGHR